MSNIMKPNLQNIVVLTALAIKNIGRNVLLIPLLLLNCIVALSQTSYPLSDTELARRIAAKEQITDLPTIYIDIPEITTVAELNAKLYKDRSTNTAPYLKATITVVDNSPEDSPQHLDNFTDSELEIKVRGNSTASVTNGKRPYRLKFASKKTSSDGKAHKHDLLGMGYEKRNWVLLANAADKTMLRNALTCELARYVGMPFCPGYKFVDLVISGLYRGTYQVTDHVEVGANRIDIDEDTGWYVEQVSWTTMAEEPYVPATWPMPNAVSIKNPDTENYTEEQITALKQEVKEWAINWSNAFYDSSRNGWRAYNDVETFIKYFIATEITGDIDAYFVFKGYREADGPFFFGPIWDKDLAYGNYQSGSQGNPSLLTAYYDKCGFEYFFRNGLFQDKSFLTPAKTLIDRLVSEDITSYLCNKVDELAELLDNTQKQNYNLFNIQESVTGEIVLNATYAEDVQQVKDYLSGRVALVKTELQKYVDALPAPIDATYNPENAWWSTQLTTNTNYNLSLVNRTLTAGEWNTFCLPFDASQAQVEAALGCTYELKVHTGIDSDGKTMLFGAPETKEVMAGVPYLICPKKDVTSFGKFNDVVYSVNVSNNQNNPYNGDAVTFDGKHYFQASLFHGYELSTATDYLFANDVYQGATSLVKATADNQLGCRAFVRVPEGETPTISFAAEKQPDVNGDGDVNVIDVTAVIDIILQGDYAEPYKLPSFDHEAADANHDNEINVLDVTLIIDIILNK